VLFGFPFQTVRIKHESIAREAFGNGARFALKELSLQTHGFYTMEDLVGRLFVEANQEFVKFATLSTNRKNLLKRIGLRFQNRRNH
jgi:hypothetical protein